MIAETLRSTKAQAILNQSCSKKNRLEPGHLCGPRAAQQSPEKTKGSGILA